jgi:hypothetical protein
MVQLAEIADPKNDFNLNLPRYIDSVMHIFPGKKRCPEFRTTFSRNTLGKAALQRRYRARESEFRGWPSVHWPSSACLRGRRLLISPHRLSVT